jgi:tRNA G18 (ribose-2'-O)-methylase SpoU
MAGVEHHAVARDGGSTARGMLIERIEDPGDPRLADYRDLRDAELRRRRGLFIAESREVVRRLLIAGRFRVRSVLLTPPFLDNLRDLLEASDAGVDVLLTSPDTIRSVVGFDFHRGCIAIGERGPEPPLEQLLGPPGARRLLVLEELANPDNVGGAFRNAMAFGVDGVLLSPGCTDPLYRKTIRVSIGGSLSVPFRRLTDWPASLTRLHESGYTILGLTPRAEAIDIVEFGSTRPIPERLAILLGTEGGGLSARARQAADVEVRIKMAAGADSLNVATACGIALHRLTG